MPADVNLAWGILAMVSLAGGLVVLVIQAVRFWRRGDDD